MDYFLQTSFIVLINIYYLANSNLVKSTNRKSLFMTNKLLAKLNFWLKK